MVFRSAARFFTDACLFVACLIAACMIDACMIDAAATHAADVDVQEPSTPTPLPTRISFNEHIRPLLSETCFTCHGPDEENNESGYRLDTFATATGVLPSDPDLFGIVPGNADASEVYRRVMGTSDGEQMPPEDFRHRLSERDKALLGLWIQQGAVYQQHWSYAPIESPPVPRLDGSPKTKAGLHPIDAFIRDKLRQRGVEPTPPAEAVDLFRRVSLDLTGLPPRIEEVDRFLRDPSDAAYTAWVDELMARPAYGERMASQWLDMVRFADTVGFHGDQNQRIFPYRDYVIASINRNDPFDQFTFDQLAADLDPESTPEQLSATGFLRLNLMTREGGAQPGEYLAKSKADRVRALGTAWLGSTLGCCECHNHKYDPFTAKDFYAFGAFFDDIKQWGVYSSYSYTPNEELRGFNNNYPFPPEMRVQSPSLERELASLQQRRDLELAGQLDTDTTQEHAAKQVAADAVETIHRLPKHVEVWRQTMLDFLAEHPDGWAPLSSTDGKRWETAIPPKTPAVAFSLRAHPDPKANGKVGYADGGRFELSVTAVATPRAVGTENLPGTQPPTEPATESNESPAESDETTSEASESDSRDLQIQPRPLGIDRGHADFWRPSGYSNGAAALYFKNNRWRSGPIRLQAYENDAARMQTAVFHLDHPFGRDDENLVVRVDSRDVAKLSAHWTPLADPIPGRDAIDPRLRAALDCSPSKRTAQMRAVLLSAHYRATTPTRKHNATAKSFRTAIDRCRGGATFTMVSVPVTADQIPPSRVLPRGNWQDESGEAAPPGFPEFLQPHHAQSPSAQSPSAPSPSVAGHRRLDRRDLAAWLTSPHNPLTARHFVNRTWRHFFGRGLSEKLDDLGNQGTWPSHPKLLDWLAADFIRGAWDRKRIVRQIVLSQTYRQAAAVRADLATLDPYNRLHAQQSGRRLEAEAIRDAALSVAGLLQQDYVGGPSVFPFQPAGHYSNLQFPNRRYQPNGDFRKHRRGVYMHWQRTFLHPMLMNFDAPSRDECAADRPLSNSPQQALTLLNDPSFFEAAAALASRTLAQALPAQALHDEALPADGTGPRGHSAASDGKDSLDRSRVRWAFRQALSRQPSDDELDSLCAMLRRQRETLAEQVSGDQAIERAAMTQLCRVLLNTHEFITRY
ncbi:MAG: PSD1 and planctomycete cytochrome C domain-containing protein [Planctomycetota bacterium]